MSNVEIDMETIPTMKVADLKIFLKERNLSTLGNKADLAERLMEAIEMEAIEKEDTTVEEDILNVQDEEEEVGTVEKETCEETAEDPPPSETQAAPAAEKPTDPEADQEKPKEEEEEKVTPKPITIENKSHFDKLLERSKRFGVSNANEDVKKLDRLKRFGASSEEAKKLARAERFGIPVGDSAANGNKSANKISSSGTTVDIEVLKKRAERFGAISSVMTKATENEKLLKRKDRFGAATASAEVEEKKKKRAERFGLTSV